LPPRSAKVLGHANEHGISANTRFEVCIAKDYPETGFDLAAFFDCLFNDRGDMGDPAGAAALAQRTPRSHMFTGRQLSRISMATVTVHHFEVWDISRGDWVRQPLKSTAERIMEVTQGKGRIVPGTAEEVDTFQLDMRGRYDPQKPRRR
jgi:hypothetical protein